MLRYLWLVLSTVMLNVMLSGTAQAAEINFNGATVGNNCPLSTATSTYNCTGAFIGSSDVAVIASGFTVVVAGPIQLSSSQGLKMSGTARLETTGSNDINITGSNNLNIAGGTIKAGGVYTIGGGAETTVNIIAGSVTNNGQKHTVRGSVTSTGNVSFATETTITGSVSGAAVTIGYKNSIGGTLTAKGDLNTGGESIFSGAVSGAAVTVGYKNSITGSLTATGAITMGGESTVTGAVSGASINTGSNIAIGGSLSVTGTIVTDSGAKINGAISGASLTTGSNNVLGSSLTIKDGNIKLGSGTTVSGAVSSASITADADVKLGSTLIVTGAIRLESRVEVTGAVSGDSIVTNSDVKLRSTLAIKGTIDLSSGNIVTGAVTGASIKTNSNTSLNGSLKVDGLAELGSSITVLGGVRANEVTTVSPVKNISGGIIADKAITIASGSTISGDMTAPTITFNSSDSTVTGNINASISLTMGSRTKVIGDIVGAKVVTADSVTINGNAAVNSIYLDGGSTVSKVITCTGPGAVLCSCVTKPSWYNYNPTCAAAPAAGAHHFQITHSGSALTCQPQTVKVTACANAACTAPHFTGSSSSVTLQPGGKSFTFTGETTAAAPATVEQTTVGTARIVATGTSGTVCVNTANASATDQCLMDFEDTGLLVNVDDHIAATSANVSIQALTATSTKQSCVPLVKDKTENISLSCGFIKPGSDYARAGAKISFSGSDLSCGAGTVRLSLAFDGNGVARTKLTYPEVGQLSLTATYAGSTAYTAKGTDTFIVAPARFNIEATSASGKKVAAGAVVGIGSAVFAKAGEEFTVKISAVNDKGEVTTNFGKEAKNNNAEATRENIKVTALAVDNPDDAGNAGDIAAPALSAITDGVTSSSKWSFSDVGIIRLDVGLNSGAGYLGAAGDQFKTAGTQKIGRFIPDHFDTSLPIFATLTGSRTREMVAPGQLAGMTMPCKATSNSTPLLAPCDPVFIYSHQPFYVIVKAYNSANGLTINYQGALAKPITLSAAATLGGATLVDTNVGAMGGSIAGTAPSFAFFKGLGRVDDPNFDLPSTISMPMFRFKALPSAATGSNPVRFFVRAVDTDGATSRRATASASAETAITAVSGRLVVPNIDGSPTSPMPVTVQAQFYDANRGFMFNPMYNAPAKSLAGYLRFDRCEKGLASVCATAAQLQPVAPGTAAFQSGKASFRLTPPSGQNGLGSVDFTMQKPCTPTPACNADAQWIYYLPSTTGKLTFGVYRSGPVIYTREIY